MRKADVGVDKATTDVAELLTDLGLERSETASLMEEAVQYWHGKKRSSVRRRQSKERVDDVLLYLTDACIPVRSCLMTCGSC